MVYYKRLYIKFRQQVIYKIKRTFHSKKKTKHEGSYLITSDTEIMFKINKGKMYMEWSH